MESLLEVFTDDVFELALKISPAVILMSVIPSLMRFLFRLISADGCSYSGETQEEITPKEEIEAPVKIKTVNKSRDIPRRCPYCYGILDNVDCCPYCGTVF